MRTTTKLNAFLEAARLVNTIKVCVEDKVNKKGSKGLKLVHESLEAHGLTYQGAQNAKKFNFIAPVECRGDVMAIDLPFTPECVRVVAKMECPDMSIALFDRCTQKGRWILYYKFESQLDYQTAWYGFTQIYRRCKMLDSNYVEQLQVELLMHTLDGTQMDWEQHGLLNENKYMKAKDKTVTLTTIVRTKRIREPVVEEESVETLTKKLLTSFDLSSFDPPQDCGRDYYFPFEELFSDLDVPMIYGL